MADVSKLKKKRLGEPPPIEEAATSLSAPEIAPAPVADVPAVQSVPTVAIPVSQMHVRRDGRSARKTNRTLPFATRVTADFDNEVRDIAEREGILLVEVLEKALQAYKEKAGY
jgi:hypothetical protein